jgi:hypothetical protein
MELLLIFFIKKIKALTAEVELDSLPRIKLLFLAWLIGEALGLFIASQLFRAGWLIYLVAASGGVSGGLLVYRYVLRFTQRSSDYFDLRSASSYPFSLEIAVEKVENKLEQPENSGAIDTTLKTDLTQPEPVMPQPNPRPATQTAETVENKLERHETEPENPRDATLKTDLTQPEPVMPQLNPWPANQTAVGANGQTITSTASEPSNQPTSPPVIQLTNQTATPAREQSEEQPASNLESQPQNKTIWESTAVTNSDIFKFPDSELLAINELLNAEFGLQTLKDRPASEYEWFAKFKVKYDNHEISAALLVLENAFSDDADNGLIWLLSGVLYKEGYQNYEKALQFFLSGAKRCERYKTALLTEAGELLLLEKKDIRQAFKIFCLAVLAITDGSKAWDDPASPGALPQERAFQFMRVLLTAYDFQDYRLYLERNVRFHISLEQTLIEKILALCSAPFLTEQMKEVILQMFPLVIEKLQSLA